MPLHYLDPNDEPRECFECNGKGGSTNAVYGPGQPEAWACLECNGTGRLGNPEARPDFEVFAVRGYYPTDPEGWRWHSDRHHKGSLAVYETEAEAVEAARRALAPKHGPPPNLATIYGNGGRIAVRASEGDGAFVVLDYGTDLAKARADWPDAVEHESVSRFEAARRALRPVIECAVCGEESGARGSSMYGSVHKLGPTTHHFKPRKRRALEVGR